MLIRTAVLERIVRGEIDTQFRRQKRPTVKAGGTLRTQVGMVEIVDLSRISLDDVTDEDARRSGAAGREQVVAELTKKTEGHFYRVRLRYAGADPRIALRTDDDLTIADVATLTAMLDRLDRSSPTGAWTRQTMRLIADRPNVRAPDLAMSVGRETSAFKNDVRKLKALGLTISHSPGYELSPRGRALLARLEG
ncbi:MAG TPA: hypothetical protein VE487_09655 [Ilumatobacter sp.]|nr:hypothetical protein [Ilumatobacter sp.]